MFRGTLLFVFLTTLTADAESRPNIVLFLVDDLGWADVGFNNPDTFYETPNLDCWAARSTVFTNGYAANPVCSPTRYSVMTGKWPSRVDATNFFAGKREGRFKPAPLNDRMPLDEVTIAETLRSAGYSTAFLGKWHLGPTEEFWPLAQGFEVNVGGWLRGLPRSYFSPYQNPVLEDGPKGEHLTQRLADEAVQLIKDYATDRTKPFFLDLSFYTVHTPLQGPKDLVEYYKNKAAQQGFAEVGRNEKPVDEFADEEQVWPQVDAKAEQSRKVRVVQRHAVYASMVDSMDSAVGQVLDALEVNDLADNTIVLFTSDNGGLSTSEGSPTSNLPLRGGKGWVYEGGIREPFVIHVPGEGNGKTVETPVCSIDLYPTICDLTGVKAGHDVDGVSLKPLITGDPFTERDLYWHYPHYSNQGGFPGGAIRDGRWKLVERYEDGRVHLYDLTTDVGERNNVAESHPERVASMRTRLHSWYKNVDAKFLQPKDGQEPWQPAL